MSAVIDFGAALESRYQDRLDHAAQRSELEDRCHAELRESYIAAVRRGPDGVLHLPHGRKEVIADLLYSDIDAKQLLMFLRDAERGEEVQTRAKLLLDTLATAHAAYHASDLADERDGS